MTLVLFLDYLRDGTSLHFTVSLINQTVCSYSHSFSPKKNIFRLKIVG